MKNDQAKRIANLSLGAFLILMPIGAVALPGCGEADTPVDIERVQSALNGDALTNPVHLVQTGLVPNANPPDTNGDVGRNHYIQTVNPSFYQVRNKQGQALTGTIDMTSFWPAGDPCRNTAGDVIVLYDHLADRWLLSYMGPHHICIAISATPDPTVADASGWHAYTFDTTGFPGDTSIPDFPKLAVWPDAYYMSSFGFDSAQNSGNAVFAFERARMLAGDPTARFRRATISGGRPFPADLDGPAPAAGTPGFFVRSVNVPGGTDRIELFGAAVNWSTGTFSFNLVATLTPTDFDTMGGNRHGVGVSTGDCIPQPHTTGTLDCVPGDQGIFRYRSFGTSSSIFFTTVVDVRRTITTFSPVHEVAGIRWYELRNQAGAWTLRQQGTFAPQPNTTDESELVHRWMSNANMDREGNVALGYSMTNSDSDPGQEIFPSMRYTGRNADDPLGTMLSIEHVIRAGTNSQAPENAPSPGGTPIWARWGDYSSMSMDPVDGCTFWHTNHLASTPGAPKPTPIAAFRFANCAPAANQTCVFGSQRVDLRDRAKISAAVGAIGSLEVGSVAVVTGDVFVSGNALLRDRSTINGDLTYSGVLSRQNNTSITGTLTQAPVQLVAPPTQTVSAGSGDQSVANDAIVTLSPGTFGNMTFRARSRVTMNPGTYTFASLNIEPDVRVTASGPVIVNVQGQFQLGDRSRVDAAAQVAFSVYSNGASARIGTDATFNGSINAPNASVTVSSRVIFNGCLAGKSVLVDTDSVLTQP